MAAWASASIHAKELVQVIDLTGQTILISGGTPALIAGIQEAMQAAGAAVHVHDEADLDVTDPAAVHTRVEQYKRIDTMVILPVHYSTGYFMKTAASDWDSALKANYERAVYLSQAAARHMIDREVHGSIVFVSTVAIDTPLMQTGVYATSLAALYPLAKMAAVDCGPYGIRVNTVTLGWIESAWTAPHLTDNERDYVCNGIPLGEIGTPRALGDVCAFLVSPLARYITGAVIPVDGGYTLTRSEGTSPYPTG
jgi:3-oxoacyl-[acyl-carrier protein] reductase